MKVAPLFDSDSCGRFPALIRRVPLSAHLFIATTLAVYLLQVRRYVRTWLGWYDPSECVIPILRATGSLITVAGFVGFLVCSLAGVLRVWLCGVAGDAQPSRDARRDKAWTVLLSILLGSGAANTVTLCLGDWWRQSGSWLSSHSDLVLWPFFCFLGTGLAFLLLSRLGRCLSRWGDRCQVEGAGGSASSEESMRGAEEDQVWRF